MWLYQEIPFALHLSKAQVHKNRKHSTKAISWPYLWSQKTVHVPVVALLLLDLLPLKSKLSRTGELRVKPIVKIFHLYNESEEWISDNSADLDCWSSVNDQVNWAKNDLHEAAMLKKSASLGWELMNMLMWLQVLRQRIFWFFQPVLAEWTMLWNLRK